MHGTKTRTHEGYQHIAAFKYIKGLHTLLTIKFASAIKLMKLFSRTT